MTDLFSAMRTRRIPRCSLAGPRAGRRLLHTLGDGRLTCESRAVFIRGQFFKFSDRIRSGFWFLPAVMAGGAIALAFVSVAVSEPLTDWMDLRFGWSFTGGAEGASAVLGTIAGSMITIAGVVFSMRLAALSLTSSELGPRPLRSFMRDSSTQVVLGTFIATFLYCLLVLRTIRRVEEVAFVPHLAVTLGVLLAVASVRGVDILHPSRVCLDPGQ